MCSHRRRARYSPPRIGAVLLASSALLALVTRAAYAADPAPPGETYDYTTRRFEPAGFPLIGGDSDIGFEFGFAGTLSHFADGIIPYHWNMDLVVAASVKSGPSGLEITQQNYQANVDIPGLLDGKLRLNPQISFNRTINQLYFGLGNASSAVSPPGASGRHFEFDDRQARVRELTRIAWLSPLDLMVGTTYRYETPGVYAGSRVAEDAAAGKVLGVGRMSLFTLALGLIYDTRDNEVFPRKGSNHRAGLRGTIGLPVAGDVRYGAFGGTFATYVPVGGPFVLALRAVVDLAFGNVPIYDLYTGGTFLTDEMPGGSSAVRGVPDGRYSGLIKALGNAELRALVVGFQAFEQSFHLGGNVLFDTGRLWTDYTFRSPLDGTGLGLKWGAGMGLYLQWGQAAVFRLEVAYSPDAVSENPRLPIGVYVEDGVMF